MAISDGLSPSIFCQKMERTRLMMEEKDGKVVYFTPELAFSLRYSIMKVLFPISTLTWRVNYFGARQGKGLKKRNVGETKKHKIYTDAFN